MRELIKTCFWIAVLIVVVVNYNYAQGTQPFDKLPWHGGLQGQGMIVYPDDEEIYVFGDVLLDTLETYPYQKVRNYYARFNYEGAMVFDTIYDSENINLYYAVGQRPVYVINDRLFIYFDEVNTTEFTSYPVLLEIDIKTGDIKRTFKKIDNPFGLNNFKSEWFSLNNKMSFVSFHSVLSGDVFLREIDSSFVLDHELTISKNGRINYPQLVYKIAEHDFELVGVSGLEIEELGINELKPYHMRVDTAGNIKSFKVMEELDIRVFASCKYCYGSLRDDLGNWFLSMVTDIKYDECPSCYYYAPIALYISADFDSLLWSISIADVPIDWPQYYFVESADHSGFNDGFVITGFETSEIPWRSFITKISQAGEQLWYRSFLPIEWEQDSGRTIWGIMHDIKATPHNSYVLVGMAYDGYEEIRRPWLVHVDSMGCLIPGCDQTVSTTDPVEELKEVFRVAPNPAADHLYLHCQGSEPTPGQMIIHLCDAQGSVLRTARMDIAASTQYIFSISSLPPGYYHVILESADRSYRQVETIIKP